MKNKTKCNYITFNDFLRDFIKKYKIIKELENIYKRYSFEGKNLNIQNLFKYKKLEDVLTCDPLKRFCLFNLNDDPCERLNLADVFPDVVKRIKNRLIELKKSVVKPLNKPEDPYSNPIFYNGTWVNWKDDIKPNKI